MRALATAALDLLFPAVCPLCAVRLGPGRHDPVCGACWSAFERLSPPLCARCGMPLASDQAACASCAAAPPPWDYARAAAAYAGTVREAIHTLKFNGRRSLAHPLAGLVYEQCGDIERPDAIVPVPLAPGRERDRGFNQSLLIAERLAERFGVRVRPRWLVRLRATAPQSGLAAAERRTNVSGAFAASPGVAGRHVLVIDDVITTGATAGDCARALRLAGAFRIGVLTVARVL